MGMARSLDGVSHHSCQMEIEREMAKTGKLYNIRVSSISASRRTEPVDGHGSTRRKRSDDDSLPPMVIAAAAFGTLLGLSFLACGLVLACRRARSAFKAASTCDESSA